MKRDIFEDFIKKYHLNGEIDKVKWIYSAEEKILQTKSTATHRSFIAKVLLNNFSEFGNENCEICIGDTNKILKMLTPFEDEINLKIKKNKHDKIMGFSILSDDCESYCSAADPSVIDPPIRGIKNQPDWILSIPLEDEFIDKFLKCYNALKKNESFSILTDDDNKVQLVFGYLLLNSNRIFLNPKVNFLKDKIQLTSFPIKNIVEIFRVNKDIKDGTLYYFDKLLGIFFKNDDFDCVYYQNSVQSE